MELVVWGIQRLQLTGERVILCTVHCTVFFVQCTLYSAVQCSARHQACPSDQQRSAERCSHGNWEQVQDTQLFQSLIMPILFATPTHPHHHHHHDHNPRCHHSLKSTVYIYSEYAWLLNVNLKQLDSFNIIMLLLCFSLPIMNFLGSFGDSSEVILSASLSLMQIWR